MRLSPDEHHKHSWRVSSLAPDFRLLDVWRFPLVLDDNIPLDRFIDFSETFQRELVESKGAAGALFRLRGVMGKVFRWDNDTSKAPKPLPIPGCTETSLRARLSEDEGGEPDAAPQTVATNSNFKHVYHDANESLAEISNGTVHALMHLGRVPSVPGKWSPQMAVFVKPRGKMGHHYMSLISPFRHYIVYPAMMRAAKHGWPGYAERHNLA